jgi:hypothetical protein
LKKGLRLDDPGREIGAAHSAIESDLIEEGITTPQAAPGMPFPRTLIET